MFFVLTVLFPFVLFIGGAYLLNYPMGLGVFYGINVALLYLVMIAVANQVLKVHSQKAELAGGNLLLSRKQICASAPVIREFDLEVPVESIRGLSLLPTRIGYLLMVRFDHDGKEMGVDIDINPLKIENRDTLKTVLATRGLTADSVTGAVLDEYGQKLDGWRRTYFFSFFLLGLALFIFFAVSLLLGLRL